MAFTLQTDDGNVVDANAYIDEVFFKTYHGDRGVAAIANATYTDTEIQEAVVVATDYIDTRFSYTGDRQNGRDTQTTEFPRLSLFDFDNRLLNGIPLVVEQACAEYALFKLENSELFVDIVNETIDPRVKRIREVVGPIEEEKWYFSPSESGTNVRLPVYPRADQRLISAGIVENRPTELVRA